MHHCSQIQMTIPTYKGKNMTVDSENYGDVIALQKTQWLPRTTRGMAPFAIRPGASVRVFSQRGQDWFEGKVFCYMAFQGHSEIVVTYSVDSTCCRKRLQVHSSEYTSLEAGEGYLGVGFFDGCIVH